MPNLIIENKVQQIGLINNLNKIQYSDSPILRLFDIFFSLTGIIFLSPIFIIAMLAIFFEDGRPIFYGQERVGRNSKIFKIWKFRSMVKDAEKKSGAVFSHEKDDRITHAGKILRATAQDELPQIFNILRGDMSIVGPRAERPVFVKKFREEIPHYDNRHKIRPGLTGIAQVFGRYNTEAKNKLRFDLVGVKNILLSSGLFLLSHQP